MNEPELETPPHVAEPATPAPNRHVSTARRFARQFVQMLLIALLVRCGVTVLAQPIIVEGPSMRETLHDSDYLLQCPLAHPRQGDVVIASPYAPLPAVFARLLPFNGHYVVKRLVATGGQTVEIRDDHIVVDGVVEPWGHGTPGEAFAPVHVPAGEVFLMGDNRPNSLDSRSYGPIPAAQIVGPVCAQLWPVTHLGTPR